MTFIIVLVPARRMNPIVERARLEALVVRRLFRRWKSFSYAVPINREGIGELN